MKFSNLEYTKAQGGFRARPFEDRIDIQPPDASKILFGYHLLPHASIPNQVVSMSLGNILQDRETARDDYLI